MPDVMLQYSSRLYQCRHNIVETLMFKLNRNGLVYVVELT